MNVIFPFVERVPRLTPTTNHTSESLHPCEEKSTLVHLLEPLCKLPVSRFIFVVGYHGDQIRSYIHANYNRMPVSFIEQTDANGLGHTVSLASDYVSHEPVLIVTSDTRLDLNWMSFTHGESSMIAVRRIVEEKPYGLVELRDGLVGCLIQKPRRTDLALAGCYFIRESRLLFRCLHDLMQNGRRRNGEYQLTDALQQMIEHGVEIRVQEVGFVDRRRPYKLRNFSGTDFEVLRDV